jgi:alkaline phosphatase
VDRQVPDSACTGTALFSGIKAPYYTLGVDAHGEFNNCEKTLAGKENYPVSMMTHGQIANKLTGFVTTARVTHATPAATYAHSPHRDWEWDTAMPANASACKDIARQLFEDLPGKNLRVIYFLFIYNDSTLTETLMNHIRIYYRT